MWRWMKKNRWLALGLVAVMLFTLLPTNLNWADIAIGEPERASSETRPTEEGKSEEVTTEAVTAETSTSSETTEAISSEAVTTETASTEALQATETVTEENSAEVTVTTTEEQTESTNSAKQSSEKKASYTQKKNVKNISGSKKEIALSGDSGNFTVDPNNGISVKVKPQGTENWVELNDNIEGLHNGDGIQIQIQWNVSNATTGQGGQTFTYELSPVVGIHITMTSGDVYNDNGTGNEVVGHWSIADGKLTVTLNEDFLNQGNVKGHLRLDGVISVDNTGNEQKKKTELQVGEKKYNVELEMDKPPSQLNVNKTKAALKMNENGTITVTYTVTAKATDGPVKDVELKDTWGTGLTWGANVKVQGNGNPTPTITPNGNGFTSSKFDLKAGEQVTVTYDLTMSQDQLDQFLQDRVTGVWDSASDDNTITADYTNDEGEPEEQSKTTFDIGVDSPSIGKTGRYIEGEPAKVEWTVTITGGSSLLDGWTLTDQLGDNLKNASNFKYQLKNAKGENVGGEVSFGSLSAFDFKDLLKQTIGEQWNGGNETAGQIVITYETEVESSAGTSVVAPTYTNKVTMQDPTIPELKYEAQNSVQGVGEEHTFIDKEVVSTDDANHTINWKTTLTIPAGATLENYVYEDNIEQPWVNGATIKHTLVPDSIKVEPATYSGSITGNTSGSSYFSINFGNIHNTGSTDITITITYSTQHEGKATSLKNTGTVGFKEGDQSVRKSDDAIASLTVSEYNILEKHSQEYDGNIAWWIGIDISSFLNSTEMDNKELVLTDKPSDNLVYVEGSARVSVVDYSDWSNYGNYGDAKVADNGLRISTAPDGTITLRTTIGWLKTNKPLHNSKMIYIAYLTAPKDLRKFLQDGSVSGTNEVKGELNGQPTNNPMASGTANAEKILDKSCIYDETTAPYINYSIDVNKGAYDLSDDDIVTVTDTPSGQMEFVIGNGIKVYKIVDGQEILLTDKVDYTWSYNVQTKQITMYVPDSTWIRIKYLTRPTTQKGEKFNVSNTVTISGNRIENQSVSNNKEALTLENYSGAVNDITTVTIYKYFGTDGLEGAKYELYELDGNNNYAEKRIAEFTTGAMGIYVTEPIIKYDWVYKLVEVTSPNGYKLDSKPYYFIIQGNDKKTLPSQFSNGDTYSGTGPQIYRENQPEGSSEITISKKAVSGSEELPGATLALYKDKVSDENKVAEWTSGATGGHKFTIKKDAVSANDELEPGVYYLVEKGAPEGYTYAENIRFNVSSTGVITAPGQNADISNDGKTLTMRDKVEGEDAEVRIYKKSSSITGELLKGATLTLQEKGGAVIQTIDTSKDNPAKITGLKKGTTYVLKETNPPAGYKAAADIEFSIDADGKVKGNNSNYLNSSDNEITMVDMHEDTTMSISKRAINGTNELPGATLQVYKKGTENQNNPLLEWISGESAKEIAVSIEGSSAGSDTLIPGDYVLVEKTAPSGYAYSENIAFTITKDGEILVGGNSVTNNTIVMQDAEISIHIDKRDITTDQPISGAEFTITDANGKGVYSWTSNGEDKIIKEFDDGSKPVAGAEYTLTETVVPPETTDGRSYEKMQPVTFKIENNGNLTLEESRVDVRIDTPEGSAVKNKLVLYNMPSFPGNFLVRKLDADTEAEIQGAKFKLRNETDKTDVVEWTTKLVPQTFWVFREQTAADNFDAPVGTYELLVGKQYSLEEIQPAFGYEKNTVSKWYFELQLTDTGTSQATVDFTNLTSDASISKVLRNASSSGNQTYDICVTNKKKDLYVSKRAFTGTNELPGATLKIYKDASNNGQYSEEILSWESTTEQKKIPLTDLSGSGKYKLVEITAPKGYACAESILFEISEDGTIKSDSLSGDNLIIMKDKPFELHVTKADIAGSEVSDAHLKVVDAAGLTVDEWDSSNVAHTITNLQVGSDYTLIETIAPDGYKVINNFPFHINEDGTITSKNSSSDVNVLRSEDNTIVASMVITDGLLTLKIKKTDEAGSDLPGATLELKEKDSQTSLGSWTSTSDDKEWSIPNGKLKGGTIYVLEETNIPQGYTGASITFELTTTGMIRLIDGASNAKVTQGEGLLVVVDKSIGDVTVSKKALSGENEIPGAAIILYEVDSDDNKNEIEHWTSETTPHVIEGKKLKAGCKYILHEDTAPAGYETTTDITFEIGQDGSIQTTSNTNSDANIDSANRQIVIRDRIENGTCFFSKQEVGGSSEIPGATIELRQNGNTVTSWTSGESAKNFKIVQGTPDISKGELAPGEYTMVETGAPQGYTYAESITFSVDINGVITVTSSNGEVVEDGRKLIMRDNAIGNVVVSKKAISGADELPGAVITLYEVDGNGNETMVESWTSGTTPHEIDGKKLKAGYRYKLHEEAAPDGYKVTTDIFFEIGQDGSVQMSSVNTNEDAEINVAIRQIVIRDRADVEEEEYEDDEEEETDTEDEETATKTATKTDSKKTGDSAPIPFAGTLFFLSLAGAGAAYGVRRKKARKK